MEQTAIEGSIFEMNQDADLEILMGRIRGHLHGQQAPAGEAASSAVLAARSQGTHFSEDGASQAPGEWNHAVTRAIGLFANHLQHTQIALSVVEEWLREETEQAAETTHRTSVKVEDAFARLEEIGRKVDSLADQINDIERKLSHEIEVMRREPPSTPSPAHQTSNGQASKTQTTTDSQASGSQANNLPSSGVSSQKWFGLFGRRNGGNGRNK